MNSIKTLLSILSVVLFTGCATTENKNEPEQTAQSAETKPLNIILLIGDGMGLSQVTASFFWGENQNAFQRFPHVSLIKTSSSREKITDSAAGATAFSAGVKTYNGAIGVDDNIKPVETVLEIAEKKLQKTGLVATSSITHATPASFFAHVERRSMEEEIAKAMAGSGVDFFAGGGLKFFHHRSDQTSLLPGLIDAGYELDTTSLGSQHDISKKYAYLLDSTGMPRMLDGRGDFLPNATKQAIDYLSQNEQGFFLMVEGSQIDWGGHGNNAEYLKTELLDFNNAINIALDFAEKNGNTLVIVTADHETGGYTLSSTPKTGENGLPYSDYNEITGTFSTGGHSATLIPVFTYGPGSEKFQGIYENTGIFDKMLEIQGWK